MLCDKNPSPDCSAVHTWLAACVGASPVPSNSPLSYRGELPNVNCFLFENINNYYFVLCGISGLLFHSPGWLFVSEFLKGFQRPGLSLQLAEILWEMSTHGDLLCLPHPRLPLGAPSIYQCLVLLKYLTGHILMRDQAPASAKASNGGGLFYPLHVLTPNSQPPFS